MSNAILATTMITMIQKLVSDAAQIYKANSNRFAKPTRPVSTAMFVGCGGGGGSGGGGGGGCGGRWSVVGGVSLGGRGRKMEA